MARNLKLKKALGRMTTPKIEKEIDNLPEYNTTNLNGHGAYAIPEELQLLALLNTSKVEPQFYQDEADQLIHLRNLLVKVAMKDPYLVAQMIVYSRCVRPEGMRTINHVAAALLSPFIRGTEWAKRFYSGWDKKAQKGGCIFRLDDMEAIKDVYQALNGGGVLANSMKKGFRETLQKVDAYQILKYKKAAINISNLVHPNIAKCKGKTKVDGVEVITIDALMRGLNVSADTWEVAQSEAGQLVAAAKREGKLNEAEAEALLKEAKANNWNELLRDKKLGILAALRNIRNILSVCDDVDALCALLADEDQILKGKIMPYQIDLAYEVVKQESEDTLNKRKVLNALEQGYLRSVPNLAQVCKGRNLVILDCSGSMTSTWRQMRDGKTGVSMGRCMDKAKLVASTIVQATGADCIRFGDRATYAEHPNGRSLFEYAQYLGGADMGYTNLASAFNLITRLNKQYDRIFILSDYECNVGDQARAYAEYIRRVNSPYIYSIDLAVYGTAPLPNTDKVSYYYGYGYGMFDDISKKEFRPEDHLAAVRKVVILPEASESYSGTGGGLLDASSPPPYLLRVREIRETCSVNVRTAAVQQYRCGFKSCQVTTIFKINNKT